MTPDWESEFRLLVSASVVIGVSIFLHGRYPSLTTAAIKFWHQRDRSEGVVVAWLDEAASERLGMGPSQGLDINLLAWG